MSTSVLSAAWLLPGLCPRAFADPAPDVAPAAAAQTAPRPDPRRIDHRLDPTRMVTDDCAHARKAGKTCELTLTPEDVGGETPSPDDIALRILQFGHEGSLVHVRHDFIVEIVRSAEDQ
ncbi:MAG TPA: hypothetical protein VF469_29780 [Kofleriaceae bacterium]